LDREKELSVLMQKRGIELHDELIQHAGRTQVDQRVADVGLQLGRQRLAPC
jgi:hypothetical protein